VRIDALRAQRSRTHLSHECRGREEYDPDDKQGGSAPGEPLVVPQRLRREKLGLALDARAYGSEQGTVFVIRRLVGSVPSARIRLGYVIAPSQARTPCSVLEHPNQSVPFSRHQRVQIDDGQWYGSTRTEQGANDQQQIIHLSDRLLPQGRWDLGKAWRPPSECSNSTKRHDGQRRAEKWGDSRSQPIGSPANRVPPNIWFGSAPGFSGSQRMVAGYPHSGVEPLTTPRSIDLPPFGHASLPEDIAIDSLSSRRKEIDVLYRPPPHARSEDPVPDRVRWWTERSSAFVEERKDEGVGSECKVVAYRGALRVVHRPLSLHGGLPPTPREVGAAQVRRLRESPLAPNTLALNLTVLRGFLRWDGNSVAEPEPLAQLADPLRGRCATPPVPPGIPAEAHRSQYGPVRVGRRASGHDDGAQRCDQVAERVPRRRGSVRAQRARRGLRDRRSARRPAERRCEPRGRPNPHHARRATEGREGTVVRSETASWTRGGATDDVTATRAGAIAPNERIEQT
jgi:hypothetical protein